MLTKPEQDVERLYQAKPFEGSSHTWAMEQLSQINPQAKVLDFGAGTGLIGNYLKERGIDNIYAVDINDTTCQNLKKVYKDAVQNIDQLSEADFDYLLLLDILEHLTDPFEFFQVIVKKVKPGGKILLSLPNIAHWSMRFSLLFGFFEYTQRGLLDETHYNHFNRSRVHQLINSCEDLIIESFDVSVSPCEFVLPKILWQNPIYNQVNKLRIKTANLFPSILGYQHLVKLTKS